MVAVDARAKLEQIRRNKKKNKPGATRGGGNVKDLRQLISSKKKTKPNDRSPNRVSKGRVTKNKPNITSGSRDLRDTNKRLASRRNLSQTRDNKTTNRTDRLDRTTQVSSRPSISNKRVTSNGGPIKSGKQLQQQQYYLPPHMQQHQPPTYIFTSAPAPASNLAMDNVPEVQGASILISNLMPSITQSEIIELFGDIGVMTAVNMINSTTALVTYQNSSDAVRAVKVYHNRLLDGKPMLVNMMPNPTPTTNVRSRVGHASVIGGHQVPMEIAYGGRRI